MSASLEWVGHACFRLWEDDGPVLVLDPYLPSELGVRELEIAGDVVVVSSLDDSAHSNVRLVRGEPLVVNALDMVGDEADLQGIPLVAVAVSESVAHPDGADPCALYALCVGGVWFLHMGDLGHALEAETLAPFADRCDVLLALTGGGLTISLEDLDNVIEVLAPRWIVPMHYGRPEVRPKMLPVVRFLDRRTDDPVLHLEGSLIRFPDPGFANDRPTIIVLEPSGF